MSLDLKCLGRLCDDPVEKNINDKNIAAFSFVTDAGEKDEKAKRKPLFLNVNAFGNLATTILQYCKKGTQLLITGSVYNNSAYIKKTDGKPAASLNVTLEKIEFVSPK